MADIIEFIGPRGAGKTTLYKHIIPKLKGHSEIKVKSDFTPYIFKKNKGWLGKIESSVRMKLKKGFINHSELFDSRYAFLKDHPAFVEYIWELISKYHIRDHRGVDNRINVSTSIGRYLTSNQNISKSRIGKYCITDEDLIHLSILIFNNSYNEVELERYLSLAPLPKAIIYCNAEPQIITDRCISRRQVFSHLGRGKQEIVEMVKVELAMYSQILEFLKRNHIKSIELNTESSIESNSEKIIDFINGL
jgi:hypothetical protein